MAAFAKEITDLHQFFQDYFTGILESDAISRFTKTLGSGFTLIDSAGTITGREQITGIIKSLHGARPGIKIWTDNHHLRQQHGNILIATYEEWQQTHDDDPTKRQATVVFQQYEAAPNGLLWLYVHESGLRLANDW